MIPIIAAVRFGTRRRWIPIPLFLVWLLLLPLCLLLLPFFAIGCRIVGISSWRSLAAVWGVLRSLSGTHLEITQGGTAFALRLY